MVNIAEFRKSLEGKQFNDYSDLYLVDDSTIAKFGYDTQILNEYTMNKLAYNNGINVPKIIKLLVPDLLIPSIGSNYVEYGFLMSKIEGVHIIDLEDKLFTHAQNKFREEISKVLELDILPNDGLYYKNSLYSILEDKVYLLDCEYWCKVSEKSINNSYDKRYFYNKICQPKMCFKGLQLNHNPWL